MNRRQLNLSLLGGSALHCLAPLARAHELPAPAVGPDAASKTRVKLADVELVDQQRRRGRLARDIVAGRIVVANFVFTTCSSVCPIISGIFAQLQQQLSAPLARDTVLLSITVDPLNDTPERMQAQAQRFGASAGWRWLTGRIDDIETTLKGFGAYSARPDDHLPMAVIGDPGTQSWYRFMGTPSADQLLKVTQQLHQQRTSHRSKS